MTEFLIVVFLIVHSGITAVAPIRPVVSGHTSPAGPGQPSGHSGG